MGDEHPETWNDYEKIVAKAATTVKKRTSREDEIEQTLDCSVPGLLSDLMEEHDGRKRPARKDLNDRLDAEGMERKVSSSTFYNWLEKYHQS